MKKNWKKVSLLFGMAVLGVVLSTGCMQKKTDISEKIKPGQSDLEYVQEKETLVVGITNYMPLDYQDGEEWVGFDVELVKAFADSLGVKVKLNEINWNQKTELLETGEIDCIWNGMTMTEELQKKISCSKAYLSNAQVVVLPSKEEKRYKDMDSCQHLLFAAEKGSTGETLLKDKKYRYTGYATQAEALQSVCDKKTDAAVIDLIMASVFINNNPKLSYSIYLNEEKQCVGFRKDSDLTEKANAFLDTAYENGMIHSLAEKYHIEDAVLQKENE